MAATIGEEAYTVGLMFENSTIQIGGEGIEAKLAKFANKKHTHTCADITDLKTELNKPNNYVSISGLDGSVTIEGTLTAKDVKFKYNGASTSLAEKIKTIEDTNMSNTIQHLTLTSDTQVKVGYPVFMTGTIVGRSFTKATVSSTDCVPIVSGTGDYKQFVGICTEVDANFHGLTTKNIDGRNHAFIRYATHGDFMLHVNDSTKYSIGDLVTYEGVIINEDEPLTYKNIHSIVGRVSGIVNETSIAVFRI